MDNSNPQGSEGNSLSRHRFSPGNAQQLPPQHGSSLPNSENNLYRSNSANIQPTPRYPTSHDSYSAYYQEQITSLSNAAMSSANLDYSPEYSQGSRQQTQVLTGSNPLLYYNVPQTSSSQPVFDAQQFSQRQNTPIMSDYIPQAYFGAEGGTSAAAHVQNTSQSSAGTFNESQSSLNTSHPNSLARVANVSDVTEVADAPTSQQHPQPDPIIAERWMHYQRQLGSVVRDINNSSLERASEALMGLSKWLLSQVVDLGLTDDDAGLHAERLNMWSDFNHTWLALGYRQAQLISDSEGTTSSQYPMSDATIHKIIDELLQLCDGVEQHGILDYQYGIWEEQIVEVFIHCLNLTEKPKAATAQREISS